MVEFKVGIVIVSDRSFRGEREDLCADEMRKGIAAIGGRAADAVVVPDDRQAIQEAILNLSDEHAVPLVLTSGGTGLAPDDVTPEATEELIDRPVPGISEWLRHRSMAATPLAALSRGVAGCRGSTLIVNLPGSPKAVRECVEDLLPILPHALKLIQGNVHDCHSDETSMPWLTGNSNKER